MHVQTGYDTHQKVLGHWPPHRHLYGDGQRYAHLRVRDFVTMFQNIAVEMHSTPCR